MIGAGALGAYGAMSDEGTMMGGAIKGGIMGVAAGVGWRNRAGIKAAGNAFKESMQNGKGYMESINSGEEAWKGWAAVDRNIGPRNSVWDKPMGGG
jgi:hypothetical protein